LSTVFLKEDKTANGIRVLVIARLIDGFTAALWVTEAGRLVE